MTELKGKIVRQERLNFKYDRRELFRFADGGETYLDLRIADEPRPMLFVFAG
jgi:hypothetical protein